MEHADLVKALCKNAEVIAEEMTPFKAHILHMGAGITGEAGEIGDLLKKAAIYGNLLDFDKLIEEMGDLEFYLEGLRQYLKITRQEVLEFNIAKLTERYGQKYTDKAAIQRKDVTERNFIGMQKVTASQFDQLTPEQIRQLPIDCVIDNHTCDTGSSASTESPSSSSGGSYE